MMELNNCQLYLQVETLADITDPNGIQLDPNILHGHLSLFSSHSIKRWPEQARPQGTSWGCWKSRILKNFALTETCGTSFQYAQPYQLKLHFQTWHQLPNNCYWPFTMS